MSDGILSKSPSSRCIHPTPQDHTAMSQKRPNLLLITTDQQRGDCLGCAGHPVLETPYLDELAEQGAYLPHAYTSVPSCTPARALACSPAWCSRADRMAG